MRLYSYIKEKLTRGENETSSNNKKLTSEDIKRKWERVEYDKYLNRLSYMEQNPIDKPIVIESDKYYRKNLFNLLIVIIFGVGGILEGIYEFVLLGILYEVFKYPIRIFLDYKFNSYKRIRGICIDSSSAAFRERDTYSIGTLEITILYNSGKSKKKVRIYQYLNNEHPITVGDSIIFIEGSLSKKVLSIESHNCDISD